MFEIEGNINFYEEINKKDDLDNDDNICLITYLPLREDFVELECHHKFNYEPLYNDIINHKNVFNKLEKDMLGVIEIRCPYCRNVQKTLLPPNDLYKNIHSVNFIDKETLLLNNTYNDYKWKKGVCMYSKDHYLSNKSCDYDTCKNYTCKNDIITHIDLFDLNLCLLHKSEYQHNYILYNNKIKKEKELKLKEEKKKKDKENIPKCLKNLKNGNQCSFKAIKEGYCNRHYIMMNK